MAVSYFLFARKLRAAAWFAPAWFVSYLPAVILTLVEMRRSKHQHVTASKYTNYANGRIKNR